MNRKIILSFLGAVAGIAINSGCGESPPGSSDAGCFLSFTTETTDKELGVNDSALGGGNLAQSFTLSEAKEISTVQLKLRKVGMDSASFTGFKVSLGIETNDGSTSKPSGTAVTSSDATIDVSTISATGGFYTFTFSSAVSLAKNTVYWLRLKATYGTSTKDLIKWIGHDGSIGAYADGAAAYKPVLSSSWQTAAIGELIDLLFKIGCE